MDGTNTGAYPSYTTTYGQYDNGANVFPAFYTNFAGTSLPSSLSTCQVNGSWSVVTNNRLTLAGYSTDGFNDAIHVYTTSSISCNIVDMHLLSANLTSSASWELAMCTTAPSNTGANDGGFTNAYRYDWLSYTYRIIPDQGGSFDGNGPQVDSSLTTPEVETLIWVTTGDEIGQSNYNTEVTNNDNYIGFGNSFLDICLVSSDGSSSSNLSVDWLRTRVMPRAMKCPLLSWAPRTRHPSSPRGTRR